MFSAEMNYTNLNKNQMVVLPGEFTEAIVFMF